MSEPKELPIDVIPRLPPLPRGRVPYDEITIEGRRPPRVDPFLRTDSPVARAAEQGRGARETLEEVEVTARRPPPGPIPGAIDAAGNQVYRVGNFVGTRDEFARQLGAEGIEQLREVGSALEGEENAQYQKFLQQCNGDRDCAALKMRTFLRFNGYANATIRETIARVESLFSRAVQVATDVLPEVVVSAARSPAVRVATGTPFGLATAVIEGAYRLGGMLSRDAVRRYTERFAPPPTISLPAPAPAPQPQPLPLPEDLPTVTITGRPTLDTVTVTAPRPGRRPLSVPVGLERFGFSTPAPGIRPGLTAWNIPGPQNLTGSFFQLDGRPRDLTRFETRPVPSPRPAPLPTALQSQNCAPPRKKRKKSKPRNVCYQGTYTELRRGLIKRRRVQIPCK